MWVFDIAEMFHSFIHLEDYKLNLPAEPITLKEFSVMNNKALKQMGWEFCNRKKYDMRDPTVISGLYNGVDSYLRAKGLWKDPQLLEAKGPRFGKAPKR